MYVNCDTCTAKKLAEYYDAVLRAGQHAGIWANVCPSCFIKFQCRLGVGQGQHYRYINNEYRKVQK